MRGRRKGKARLDAVQALADTNTNTLVCTECICACSSVHRRSCPGAVLASAAEVRKGRGGWRRRRRKQDELPICSTTRFWHSPVIAKPYTKL